MTSALDGGKLHAPAALPVRKELRHPLYRTLGGPQSRSGHCEREKNFAPVWNRTPAVQLLARRYTGVAIRLLGYIS
jgi:hypothetical protein